MQPADKPNAWRLKVYNIIFKSDTRSGQLFDIILLGCIVLSVLVVILESEPSVNEVFHQWLFGAEWFFTITFTIEYIARISVVPDRRKYIFSFFGLIDLLSILPTYLTFFIPGSQSLLVIRSIRLLRIFRILKMSQFVGESQNLARALRASQYKITVFLFTVFTAVIITGTLMFLIEGPEHGFTSIPKSIYWAIVTMTTVGYGDITPQTVAGQMLASIIMILGYGIIAVPTGIVSAEIIQANKAGKVSSKVCPHCLKEGHEADALYCKFCSRKLEL